MTIPNGLLPGKLPLEAHWKRADHKGMRVDFPRGEFFHEVSDGPQSQYARAHGGSVMVIGDPEPARWVPPKPAPKMGKFRNFPANVDELAARCSANLICTEEFEIIGNHAGGGSIAFPVRLKGSGLLAWVKPAVAAGDNARTAAHEKIVADFAHALGFPVAPVMLSRMTKGHGLPLIVALSFATLKQPTPWNGVAGILSDKHKAALRPQLSAMLALHCWIDDHDHDWNEGNALFECDADGTARTVFYDYGHSLTHQWNPPAAAPVRDWRRRQGPWSHAGQTEINDAIDLIAKLAVNDWRLIIERIPPDCLAPALGGHLITALIERRAHLANFLNIAGAP